MNNLKTIESAIRRLEAMYECNHEVMDADDQGDLLVTIKDLEYMRRDILHDEYKKKVSDFLNYVVSTMPDDSASNEEYDRFYAMDFTIKFGDQELLLQNGADTYQPIVDMLKDHLEDL